MTETYEEFKARMKEKFELDLKLLKQDIELHKLEAEYRRQERRDMEKHFKHLALIGIGFVVLITVTAIMSAIF
jgi:hypothetical protein